MKRLLFTLGLLCSACVATQSADDILAKVWESDQNIRHQMSEVTKAVTADGRIDLIDSLITLSEDVERVDARNMEIVDSLLRDGLPSNLTQQSYKTIWIVIDHSTIEKQEHYLPLIEQMARKDMVGADEYAVLFDRIAMKRCRPQRYGSQSVQFGSADAMNLYIYPVENPKALDSLRTSVGLSPIADYLEQLTTHTGIEAKYEPEMTVEQIEAMRRYE